ncbi:unnamed protein product [Lampetra planeri]
MRLADLLSAAASEMAMDKPEGEMAPRGEWEANPPATAKFRVRETMVPLATWAAAISQAWEMAAILSAKRKPLPPNLMGRHLRAPRTTLASAYAQMAAIYDPLSSMQHKFATRRWKEAEMPLTFHSALMSLGQAAFPNMDHAGLDSLVL